MMVSGGGAFLGGNEVTGVEPSRNGISALQKKNTRGAFSLTLVRGWQTSCLHPRSGPHQTLNLPAP